VENNRDHNKSYWLSVQRAHRFAFEECDWLEMARVAVSLFVLVALGMVSATVVTFC